MGHPPKRECWAIGSNELGIERVFVSSKIRIELSEQKEIWTMCFTVPAGQVLQLTATASLGKEDAAVSAVCLSRVMRLPKAKIL